jgi:hypothetical protein
MAGLCPPHGITFGHVRTKAHQYVRAVRAGSSDGGPCTYFHRQRTSNQAAQQRIAGSPILGLQSTLEFDLQCAALESPADLAVRELPSLFSLEMQIF